MADPTDLLSSLGSVATPGVALGALGLGGAALMGDRPLPGQAQIAQQGQSMLTQGNQLLGTGLNGPLPPAAQAQLGTAAEAEKAGVRSSYAKMGLSGSTMEAQAMQSVDEQKMAAGWKMTQTLVQDGLAMAGMGMNDFLEIAKLNASEDQSFMKALGSFSGALAGAGKNG